MSVGLFFENWVHYNGISPQLSHHVRKNKEQIIALAELLYDDNVAVYPDGTGRSGKVARRFERNFTEGLGKLAYLAGTGLDFHPEKGDVYLPISGSGRKTLEDRAKDAKKYGMKVVLITRNPESDLAKKESDIVITMPASIAGESHIKSYFERLVSNQSGEKEGENIPFQALGAVFEMSGLAWADAFSVAYKQYTTRGQFSFNAIEDKLYNSTVYMGETGEMLEKQSNKIHNLVGTILKSEGNVYLVGFRFNKEIGEIGAIRMHHEIGVRGGRRAGVIDFGEFPKIKKGDVLIPISEEGETKFTNLVTQMFVDAKNPVFPMTCDPGSELARLAGIENSIIFPTGKHYSLSEEYVIGDFEPAVVRVVDGVALSLGRSEAEMQKTHSVFS